MRIEIGTITKPQALKGAFRVKPNILSYGLLKKLKNIEIENKDFKVESVSVRDSFVIFKIEGIDTCEMAESLRQKKVFADLDIEISNHYEVVGYSVKLEDNIIGKVSDLQNFGSTDILSVNGDKPFMIPVVDGLIENVDNENKIVTLSATKFDEVVVYEN